MPSPQGRCRRLVHSRRGKLSWTVRLHGPATLCSQEKVPASCRWSGKTNAGCQSLALQPRRTANNTLFTNREDSGADSSSYYPSASRTEADGSPDSDVFLPSSLRDGLSYLFPALRNYSAWASSSRPVSAKEEGSRRPFTDTPCSKTPAGIWLICHCSQ